MHKAMSIATFLMTAGIVLSFFGTSMANETIKKDVCKSAEIKSIAVRIEKVISKSAQDQVTFDVTLKNIDTVPRVFSIMIFAPKLGGAEGFVPEKDGQTLAPGAEAKTSIGILGGELPKDGYTIKVQAVEER